MKPMRILVFIALLIPAFVLSQPSIRAGQIADLLARIQQLPAHGTDAEQELAQILAAADVEPVSPVVLRTLLYLLRQQAPEGMLREHLLASVVRKGTGRSQEPAALLANVPPVARFDDRARGAAAQSSLIPVLEDFQVNISYNPCHNYDPVISVNDRGDFVVVWADDCYGGSNIACQRFSADGTKQGIVLMPNRFACKSDHEPGYTGPVVTLGNNGSFLVAWLNLFDLEPDIYCQRYDSSGNTLGENFRIHDDDGVGFSQYAPAIAIDDSGNFIVVWLDDRNGNIQVYFQRYDASGTRQGGNCRLYDDSLSFSQSSPDICVDAGGNFWIVWADNRNGNYDIYGQHFDAGGTKIDTTFRIDDDSTGSDQYATKVEIDGNGNLLVAWIDLRNGNKDIYCQRLDANGVKTGANLQVNDVSNGSMQYSPSIGVDASGNFVLLWLDDRSGTFDIYCQRFEAGGVRQDGNFRIRHDAEQMTRYSPSVGMDAQGNFVAVWQGKHDRIGEIHGQRYDANGMEQNANFKINGESDLGWHETPAIGVDSSGNFSIVWAYNDYNTDANDGVHGQRFNAQGVKMGAGFKVDETDQNGYQSFPAIGVNASGRFVVAWQDCRNGNYDVYFRCYDANGVVLDEDFQINDDRNGNAFQGVPAADLDENDNIVVVWQDQRRGNHDIFYQAYHPLSGFIGVNSQTNSDAGTGSQTCPALGLSPSGKFVVVWQDNRHGDDDIFGQRYLSFEDSLGGNFRINDDITHNSQSSPAVSMDVNGNFVVAWVDKRNGKRDIYGQRYAANGARRGVNFHVNDSPVGFDAISPAVATDETGNFVIVWQYIRENRQDDIYAQVYDHLGNPAGANYRIDNKEGLEYQGKPDVKMANGLIYYTWEDSRCRGGNTSIFARVDRSPFKKMIISPTIHAHALAEEFYVDILLSDVLNLFSLSFQLNFPADKIDAIAAEAGDFLGADVGFFAEIHKNTGAVRIYLSKKSGQDGSNGTGVVARIKLKEKPSVNSGVPIHLSLSDVVAHDPQGDAITLTPENSSYITPTPTSVAASQPLPDQYALFPNYPNPFNPTTVITYALPEPGRVILRIFDRIGRRVKTLMDAEQPAGTHTITWDGRDENSKEVANGMYLCRMMAGELVQHRKMILVR